MRYDLTASLNNVELTSISESIFIVDIEEEPKVTVDSDNRGSYGKTLLNEPERELLDIKISLMIKEHNRIKRQAVISEIKGWAKKGWLRTNLRDNQRIFVVCTTPMIHKAFQTHEKMEITFTAYDEAYWQEEIPASVSLTGSSATAQILPLGTRKCFLEAEITNASGSAISQVSLSANGHLLKFSGLTFANAKKLVIRYDEQHVLRAEIDGTSVLSKRTEDSSDDITLPNKTATTVTFTATGSCSVKLIARGLYD